MASVSIQHPSFLPRLDVAGGTPQLMQSSPEVVLIPMTTSIDAQLHGYFPVRLEDAFGSLLPQSSPVALGLACPSPFADDLTQDIMGSPVALAFSTSSADSDQILAKPLKFYNHASKFYIGLEAGC